MYVYIKQRENKNERSITNNGTGTCTRQEEQGLISPGEQHVSSLGSPKSPTVLQTGRLPVTPPSPVMATTSFVLSTLRFAVFESVQYVRFFHFLMDNLGIRRLVDYCCFLCYFLYECCLFQWRQFLYIISLLCSIRSSAETDGV